MKITNIKSMCLLRLQNVNYETLNTKSEHNILCISGVMFSKRTKRRIDRNEAEFDVVFVLVRFDVYNRQ